MVEHDKNRISWHQHHMLLAITTSQRSPDPSTKVGACIVDNLNRVVGIGYNGMPRGINPSLVPWDREGSPEKTKYPYVQHAERNAILNATSRNLEDCAIYTTLFPCSDCAGLVIQSGIRRVYFLDNKYDGTSDNLAAKKMLELVDIHPQEVVFQRGDIAKLIDLLNNLSKEK